MSRPRPNGIPLSIAAAIVLVASFMPWGKVTDDLANGMVTMSMTVNGWGSSVVILGTEVPNWLPAIIAISLALWNWMDRRIGRRATAYVLAIFGLIQSMMAFIAFEEPRGIGGAIVALVFVAILGLLIRMHVARVIGLDRSSKAD